MIYIKIKGSILLDSEQLKKLVLASFEAEKNNDIEINKALLHPNFKMVDMVLSSDLKPFPSLEGEELEKQIQLAFPIKGRQFVFHTVIADEDSQKVIIEFTESYPDPKSKKVYRTPQIAVCEIKDGKIYRTRHYMDPRISHKNISSEDLEDCFR